MKRIFINVMLHVLFALAACAQGGEPCGVYEGTDKSDGLTRQGYMEINISGASVPDFSQTFKKGEIYNFKMLPSDFMKKPSQFFAGKKSTGFVKFRSKMLISNTEILMLSDPEPVEGGYMLKWASDMGKTGTCMLHVENADTLWFTGLGSFHESIGPDKLVFARQTLPEVKKSYLSGGSAVSRSGTLTGRWMGSDGLMIKLNSVKKVYEYNKKAYHGIIEMNGPGYVKEGVVEVKLKSPRVIALYSIPLDTDVNETHYSEIRIGDDGKSLSYHLCGGVAVRTQMFKLITNTAVYPLRPFDQKYYGMFSTGKEVVPVPLNFFFKQFYDNGEGEMKEGYGCLTLSYNMGAYIDNDFIYEAKILDNGNVSIKYECDRSYNKYSALLVWNESKKTWTVTKVTCLSGEAGDCYMMNNPMIKLVGDIE